MKYFILLIPFLLSAMSVEKEWSLLSKSQQKAIIEDYHYGKQYDVGLTLASINWAESTGCKFQIHNNQYGCYHQHIKYFLSDYEIPDTKYNRSLYATKLVVNKEWSRDVAIKKILTLYNRYKSWDKAIGAYNGTSNFTTHGYQKRIYRYMRFLKRYIK
ncbi:MAG: hypothetical protein PVF17_00040 [Ignavibacteria bacterium]|jgi:hypothetical protein